MIKFFSYLGLSFIKNNLLLIFPILLLSCSGNNNKDEKKSLTNNDWLIDNSNFLARIEKSTSNSEIILMNGLIRRKIRLMPNVFTYDYTNLKSGEQLIRATEPEARIKIDDEWYNVGGVEGQKERGYLTNENMNELFVRDTSFVLKGTIITDLTPLFKWNIEKWWAGNKRKPKGKEIVFNYVSNSKKLPKLEVNVHYAIYDGLPVLSKWVTIKNKSDRKIRVDQIVNEQLSMVEEESAVVGDPLTMEKPKGIYVESDFAFNNAMNYRLSDQTTHWLPDSLYTSQVNYNLETPTVLQVYPNAGTGVQLKGDQMITSVRTWELLIDSYDKERRGLAKRKMYRTIAPWTTANPIFMHVISKNDDEVINAIDQCAEVGYEAIILSFGSHLNMDDTSDSNLNKWKKIAQYAHDKGIKIGGYSLFSSRSISPEDDVINPKTGKPGGAFFGNAPCFGSEWGIDYSNKIKQFFEYTKFDIWENDGPYPGDLCASTEHPGHEGLMDSQWKQFKMQADLYHWLNARGIYINSPDWYFLQGSHKIALGYRETNFSLPRDNQKILNRQNIYDGTWGKTPSMGWGFVPIMPYHGGGKDAILEPLEEHLRDYKQLMFQYYGSGIQATYRGLRLYDTERTRDTVKSVINWYKKYREILNADIIHLRRPDGRDWDGILHVAPQGDINGISLLYNPLNKDIIREINLPLYYAGSNKKVEVTFENGNIEVHNVNRNYHVRLKVMIPANGYTWFTIKNK